jgi:hypothetical protein
VVCIHYKLSVSHLVFFSTSLWSDVLGTLRAQVALRDMDQGSHLKLPVRISDLVPEPIFADF